MAKLFQKFKRGAAVLRIAGSEKQKHGKAVNADGIFFTGWWQADASHTNLPKGKPSGHPKRRSRRYASRTPKGKKAKGMKKKAERPRRFERRRTVRMSQSEEEILVEQARNSGLSVSEYMRRLFFGGRPIVAKTDNQAIRELRRLGGLLKHNFGVVEATKRQQALAEMSDTLRTISMAIDKLGSGG